VTIDSHCARCLRPAPDEESDEFLTWEVLKLDEDRDSDRLVMICEDCLTPEEQQAMANDDEATAEAAAELVRREYVPDLNQRADWLLTDLRGSDKQEGWLDAVGTLTGLTEDDLVELAVLLARRLIAGEEGRLPV